MKKNKQKSIVKESRKLAKKELENKIIEALRNVIGSLGKNQKKIDKLITKNAKTLVKKLSGEITSHPVAAKPIAEVVVKAEKKTAVKVKTAKKEAETTV